MMNLWRVILVHWMQGSYWCIEALSVRLPVSIERDEAGLVVAVQALVALVQLPFINSC
jgi:hypothetical protein